MSVVSSNHSPWFRKMATRLAFLSYIRYRTLCNPRTELGSRKVTWIWRQGQNPCTHTLMISISLDSMKVLIARPSCSLHNGVKTLWRSIHICTYLCYYSRRCFLKIRFFSIHSYFVDQNLTPVDIFGERIHFLWCYKWKIVYRFLYYLPTLSQGCYQGGWSHPQPPPLFCQIS